MYGGVFLGLIALVSPAMSSLEAEDALKAVKQENMELRRMIAIERMKSLKEREKRLHLEAWFRNHLRHCKSRCFIRFLSLQSLFRRFARNVSRIPFVLRIHTATFDYFKVIELLFLFQDRRIGDCLCSVCSSD